MLLFWEAFSQKNNISATKINQIALEANQFLGFDAFGYYYTINNNVFSKIKDNKSFEYKNISLGEITHIDKQNPLKIVVFYENFNTIILLDNQLNESQKINFSETETPIAPIAIGLASQNRIWIYNNLTQQIGFFDYLKNSFQSITQSLSGNLKHYETDFNSFQWIDDRLNWYSCDVFGKITSLGKIPDFDSVKILSNKGVLYLKEGLFYFYDIDKKQTCPIENVEKTSTNFYYKDQILSIFTNKEISHYKIKIP